MLVNFQFLGQNTQDKQLKKRRCLFGLVLRFPPTVFGSIALGLRQHICDDRACNGRLFTQSPEEDEGWSQGSQLPRIALALKTCSKALARESTGSGEEPMTVVCQMHTLLNYLLNIYASTRRLVLLQPWSENFLVIVGSSHYRDSYSVKVLRISGCLVLGPV